VGSAVELAVRSYQLFVAGDVDRWVPLCDPDAEWDMHH
jgi:ketosteroid isomerase-like protein